MIPQELSLLVEFYRPLPRQGPGSDEATRKALDLLPPGFVANAAGVLDAGCGTGAQTLVLAKETAGPVTAVDIIPEFLDELQTRAAARGLARKISPVRASMDALPFAPASFDLIWSEGAVYHLGFRRGLELWRPFLRPGGFMILSELTWLSSNPPEEVRIFWNERYPGMADERANMESLAACGLTPRGSFVLPQEDWMRCYYAPMKGRAREFRKKHPDNASALALLNECAAETAMFTARAEHYGYVFYIAQNP